MATNPGADLSAVRDLYRISVVGPHEVFDLPTDGMAVSTRITESHNYNRNNGYILLSGEYTCFE